MTPTQVIDLLNECLKDDPKAINELFEYHVPVNNKLAEHPFVIITHSKELGILGLLNGILCRGSERIVAIYDTETHELVTFEVGRGYTQL